MQIVWEQILTNFDRQRHQVFAAGTTVTFLARSIMYDPGDGANPTEMVEFLVSDQGVGIPEEHLPKIFHKFSRLDNPLVSSNGRNRSRASYITRSLALALDGDITVASGAGGSTFTVRLPAATYEKQAQRGRDLA
ncbi:ATP-binding protein [Candidatus Obscuribacterales bacterium]|nr:ATP-binding protein [Candidatus Obscuribacterales bacterium]